MWKTEYRHALICMTFAMIACGLFVSTCGPKVRVSSLSSEAVSIKNWTVVQIDSLPESILSGVGGTRVALDRGTSEFHSAFVDEVRRNLTTKYGVAHYDNMPTGGVISIRCFLAPEHASLSRDTLPPYDESAGLSARQATSVVTYALVDKLFHASPVKVVEVTIYRDDGYILGMFRLGDGKDERVRPVVVAKNIAKVLKGEKRR